MPGDRHWADLPPVAKGATSVAALLQVTLLVAALRDLRRRTAAELNGPRWVWALVCFVNVIGPLSYFRFGRRTR
jgi:Phospholipase_D-nuclease N-terminal